MEGIKKKKKIDKGREYRELFKNLDRTSGLTWNTGLKKRVFIFALKKLI